MSIAVCIGCGCTDVNACEAGCFWLRVDRVKKRGVCSECPSEAARFDRGDLKLSTQARLEIDMRREFGT